MSGLQSVTFTATSTVTTAGESAFNGCNNASFTSIVLPASAETVGVSAFEGCTNLATINIPNNVSLTTLSQNILKSLME